MEEGAGVSHVHVKVLLAHTSKLQVDVVVVVLVYQLKVFYARLVDSPVEVQHERLHLCNAKTLSEKGKADSVGTGRF